jgi:hypothetical protein
MEQALRRRSNIKNEPLWEVYDGIAFTIQEKKEKKHQQQGDEICALTFSGDGEDAILPKEKGSEQGKRLASFFILRGTTSWPRKRTGSWRRG